MRFELPTSLVQFPYSLPLVYYTAVFAYGGLYTYWRLFLIELGELLRLGGCIGRGGGWGIHRSFLRSRDPRLARYVESSFGTTPPYGVHTIIHLHSRVTVTLLYRVNTWAYGWANGLMVYVH